jgi:hypothetical protein
MGDDATHAPRGAQRDGQALCAHARFTEVRNIWIETCDDCGAWRDRVSGHPDTWFWRQPNSFKRLPAQPPDIGADVPGGGAV